MSTAAKLSNTDAETAISDVADTADQLATATDTAGAAATGSDGPAAAADVPSSALNPSLVKLKLLDCMRNDDTSRLDGIVATMRTAPTDANLERLQKELLHYSVQVGPLTTVKHIVSAKLVDDINYQDASGNTPLHLAAISARNDVIEYLMGLPEINDCLLNKDLKQPIECTSNMDIVQLMSDLRTKYVEVEASKLRRGFQTRDFAMLQSVLASPRARELLDINGTDPVTGDTVLLEFVKNNDVQMVQFILKHGGDPFKRSVGGKLPIDCATTPEMRSVLRRACNTQTVIDSSSDHPQVGPPTCKGFLKKWTNFAGGYKLRWFVLDAGGRLSYYKAPTDLNTCRGMVHLAHAQVRMDSSEKCRFELLIPNTSGGSPVRWHMRANHQIESNRWVWTLQNAIRYARDQEKIQSRASQAGGANEQPGQLMGADDQYGNSSGICPQLPRAPTTPNRRVSPQELARKQSAHRRGLSTDGQSMTPLTNSAVGSSPSTVAAATGAGATGAAGAGAGAAPDGPSSSSFASAPSTASASSATLPVTQSEVQLTKSSHSSAAPKISVSTTALAKQHTPPDLIGSPRTSNHVRSTSRSSATSTSSRGSIHSVTRRAKKLYKTPMRSLSKLTKRKKKSSSSYDYDDFETSSVENESTVEESDIESVIEPVIRGEYDDDQVVDDALIDVVVRQKKPDNKDIIIVRNQIKIELSSFNDFLNTAKDDPSVSKEQIVSVSQDILNNLDQLYEKEGQIMENKETKLEKMFERQHEISTLWETSLKQLEMEIQDREKKICELEDTIKSVRKSLKASVIIPAVTEAPKEVELDEEQADGEETSEVLAPTRTGRASVSSVQADERLKRFLTQTDDSDDEFYDAEEIEEAQQDEEIDELRAVELAEEESNLEEIIDDNAVVHDEEEDEPEDAIVPVEEAAIIDQEKVPAADKETDAEEADKNTTGKELEKTATEPDIEQFEKLPEGVVPDEEIVSPGAEAAGFKPVVDTKGEYIVDGYPVKNDTQGSRYEVILKDKTFEGYEDPLRTTLGREDNRPKISLWGVLKSLVGKDMTRMTLPVSFNEPTSLLQRNMEVLEYSPVLDLAASKDFSPLRLVYVCAFAASEYISTVGRIAKPFNPLLGETFEYARPDEGYRVLVEQVSHHPPISALWAESPFWSYYGEADVKTKFYGRSFDIKHLGTWFCEIYPSNGTHDKDNRTRSTELYSWKKINNSVVGIIMGHPSIDNYGEMEIRNHVTGDYAHLNFKQRGWRESSAYELKAEIYSADGKLQYTMGGKWNSKIYAKSATEPNAKKFLVWQANKTPKDMMFHLTSFAAGLNAPQPHLLPVIACTDTRLRPDQRAMEDGEYDKASEEKSRLEDKQRAAARKREANGEVYKPEFFVMEKHPVTGERYWRYKGNYWEERKNGELKNYKDIF